MSDTISDEHAPASPAALAQRITLLEQRIRQLDHLESARLESDWFFEHSPDMLAILSLKGEIRRANRAFWQVLGYAQDELLGQSMKLLLFPDDLTRLPAELAKLHSGLDSVNFELRLQHKTGAWRYISWTCPGFDTPDRDLYIIGRDVTANKQDEAALLYKAEHDALTGLCNRARFDQALQQALNRIGRNPALQMALLLVDLDGFKAVNDVHGHSAGDALLTGLAERFVAAQRKDELVCRIGGDEFAWLVENARQPALEALAARILAAASVPIDIGGVTVQVGCSIGIAILQLDDDATQVYQRADRAMYAVKRAGKNSYRIADHDS